MRDHSQNRGLPKLDWAALSRMLNEFEQFREGKLGRSDTVDQEIHRPENLPPLQSSEATGQENCVEELWIRSVRETNERLKCAHSLLQSDFRHSNKQSHLSNLSCNEIEERARSISTSYQALHDILIRHEPTIQARWTKKRPTQKRKLLLALWPNMPKMHRPDFHAQRLGGNPEKRTKYRDWYMWPYINEHDLMMPQSLLLLINSRGSYPPSTFVEADKYAMKCGLANGILKSVVISGYSMTLDTNNLDDYGKLVDISEYSELKLMELDYSQCCPYYGVLVLEAQDRLLKFLVDCCKQILHDIPEESLMSDEFPILPEAPSIVRDVEKSSPALMAAEVPYRVPSQSNFRQISLIFEAKAAEAKDHIVKLREDPAYFVNCMMMIREYLQGTPSGLSVNRLSGSGEDDARTLLASDVAVVVGRAYTSFACFTYLHQKVHHLQSLLDADETKKLPANDMPDEIIEPLIDLRTCLWEVIGRKRIELQWVISNSPAWRRYYDYTGNTVAQPDKGNLKATVVRQHLQRLLACIAQFDSHQVEVKNAAHEFLPAYVDELLPLYMDELETLRENEPAVWELTSSFEGDMIDELNILVRGVDETDRRLLELRGFDPSYLLMELIAEQKWKEKMRHIYLLIHSESSIYHSSASLADYSNKRFFYPWERRRNRENVKAMQDAEWNLDLFWAAADQAIFDHIEGLHKSFIGRQIRCLRRTLRRTPDWIEKSEPAITKHARQRKASQGEVEIYTPPFSPDFEQSEDAVQLRQGSSLYACSKVKTRGTPQSAVAQTNANIVKEFKPKPLPIYVDIRALKVFRVLFYNPDITSSSGGIPWKDFIHAMVCTGFSAQKLQGSMWQFSRVNNDSQQTILFHEPHPYKKLPFLVARSMGWRLNRHFQWTLESFELKKKQI